MKGSGLLVLCLLAHALCSAQDLSIAPAFEHTNFPGTDGYVDGSGACLGLRLHVGNTRSTIELRPAYTRGTNIITSHNYQRRDIRAGGTLSLLWSKDIDENFAIEYGAMAGYFLRWIDVQYELRSSSAQQHSLTIGGSVGIRASSLRSVQPFLSLHPFFERGLKVWYTSGPEQGALPLGSQVGLSICVGFIFGRPSQGNAWEQ